MPKRELRQYDHDFVGEMGPTIVQDATALTESVKDFTKDAKIFCEFVYPKYYSTLPVLAGVMATMVTSTLTDVDYIMDRVPAEQRDALRHALIRALAQVEQVTGRP